MRCITSVTYSVNVNGKLRRVFHLSRGLHQGDPFSSFLFLLCSKGLSVLMRLTLRGGFMKEAKASRRGPQIYHLLFTDDSILFGEASDRGVTLLKEILHEFEIAQVRV